jgi:uncharacterized protein (TIGR02145 family)
VFKHLVALDASWDDLTEESKDPFGFSALPGGGVIDFEGGYSRLYSVSYYWTSTPIPNNTGCYTSLYLYGASMTGTQQILRTKNFNSVRCVKKD